MMTRRQRSFVALLALGLLAGGCSESSDGGAMSTSNDDTRTATATNARAGTRAAKVFPQAATIEAPRAERRPKKITQHGETRTDPYAWLRADNWQELLKRPSALAADIRAHLEAENAYYDRLMAGTEGLRDKLLAEMRGRIKEDDSSVPLRDGPYQYYERYREGGEHPIYARRPAGGGEETVLFDGEAEATGEDFFNIRAVRHSPDHALIAYGVDRVGSEYYKLRVREIASGEEYEETIDSTGGKAVWAADSESFFYVERDRNQRPKRVKRHVLGTDPAEDTVVYEESSDGLFVSVDKSLSGEYIFIRTANQTTSETRFVPAAEPAAEPTLIAPRKPDELYEVAHRGEHFYVHTNAGDAVDFKIVRAPVDNPGREHWEDWLAHDPGTYLERIVTYADYLVRLERADARPRIVVSRYDGEAHEIAFDAAAYSLDLIAGYEHDSETTRFVLESPKQPAQTFDYDMSARERELRKTQPVPSGHDPARYVVERFDAPADDGARVPVTVLRLEDTPVNQSAPVVLYGYGSYGAFIDDDFSITALSLVDRGVIYAVAHVRGGSARGRQWYLDGKLDKKTNSFTDLIASAEALIERNYTRRGNIVIYGRSAGGLLVGATVNRRPELFGGVIAGVPFVDVLNTISDGSLPLTPPEWPEWGNPIESKADYETIKAYSPYDNIREDVEYPPIMATAGLADYRVTYWEPAKWIARLRTRAKGGPFLLKTNMEAGHAGSAARFERLREQADLYAFALKALGLADGEASL